MASYSLPARYQSYLGAGFFSRQLSNIADALPGVLSRGLAPTPSASGPASPNPGLPDTSQIDKAKPNYALYAGLGVGALVLLGVLTRKKKAS